MNPTTMLFVGLLGGFLSGTIFIGIGVVQIAKAGRDNAKDHMDKSLFYMKERNEIDRLTCSHLGRIAERLEDPRPLYLAAAINGLSPFVGHSTDLAMRAEAIASAMLLREKDRRDNTQEDHR